MNEKKELEKLVLDLDKISSELKEYKTEINIFDILKITYSELKHSIMLSYLLNPHEGHGLSDKFLELFLKRIALDRGIETLSVFDLVEIDYNDFSVAREYEHIDIMIKSDKHKLVICIENKIKSGENGDQLITYKEFIEKTFPDYKRIFLYLTPDNLPSSDTNTWISFGYEDIFKLLDELNLDELDYKNRILVSDYKQMIRRSVMKDEELKQLCNKIYQKYKPAFDLIYEYKDDDFYYIRTILCDWLREKSDKNLLTFDEKFSTGKILRFITPTLEQYFNVFGESSNKKKYLTRFEVYIGKDGVAIGLSFGYELNTTRKEIYEKANEYLKNFDLKLSNFKESTTDVYKQLGTITLDKLTFEQEIDKKYLYSRFDEIMNSFFVKEQELSKNN